MKQRAHFGRKGVGRQADEQWLAQGPENEPLANPQHAWRRSERLMAVGRALYILAAVLAGAGTLRVFDLISDDTGVVVFWAGLIVTVGYVWGALTGSDD